MSETFHADWLALRRRYDAVARDKAGLTERFAALLSDGPVRLMDLAAGSGANRDYLTERLGRPIDWTVVDSDRELLRQGSVGSDRVEVIETDLATGLDCLPWDRVDGVVSTAFLDLVSASWIDDLVAHLAMAGVPVLLTLSVDGTMEWLPGDADDEVIDRGFMQDQARDKGFGPSLGGLAWAHAATCLAGAGFDVSTADSPWEIHHSDRVMLAEMIDGTTRAAVAGRADEEIVAGWRARRKEQVRTGALCLTVGHKDILAIPAREITS